MTVCCPLGLWTSCFLGEWGDGLQPTHVVVDCNKMCIYIYIYDTVYIDLYWPFHLTSWFRDMFFSCFPEIRWNSFFQELGDAEGLKMGQVTSSLNGVIREFNDQIATGWEVWQSTILQILNFPDLKWSFQNPLLEESRTAWFRHASWAAFASESSQSRCRCILRAPCIRRCEGPIFAALLSWTVEKPMLKPYWKIQKVPKKMSSGSIERHDLSPQPVWIWRWKGILN